jgi:hypothetical protein
MIFYVVITSSLVAAGAFLVHQYRSRALADAPSTEPPPRAEPVEERRAA